MDVTTATRLTQAGLGRQAAATAAGELVGVLDDVLSDVRAGLDGALGTSKVTVSQDRAVKMWSSPDIDALLHGGGGQGVVDALGAVDDVLAEARSLAGVAGDASMERVLRQASERTRLAQSQVEFAIRAASGRVADPQSFRDWVVVDTAVTKYAVERVVKGPTLAGHVRDVLGEVARATTTTRALAADAGNRVADFDELRGIAAAARAASASATDVPGKVAPLVRSADDLFSRAVAIHSDDLPSTMRVRDELAIDVDALAMHRHLASSRIATDEARALLAEAGTILDDAGDAHLDLRQLVKDTRATVETAFVPRQYQGPTTYALAQKFEDTLVDAAQVGKLELVGTHGRASVPAIERHDFPPLNHLFFEGLFKTKVAKAVRADPTSGFRGVFSFASKQPAEAIAGLRARVDAEATGTATRSMLGTGTLAAVQDALAATRARFGSAAELQDALAAARTGG